MAETTPGSSEDAQLDWRIRSTTGVGRSPVGRTGWSFPAASGEPPSALQLPTTGNRVARGGGGAPATTAASNSSGCVQNPDPRVEGDSDDSHMSHEVVAVVTVVGLQVLVVDTPSPPVRSRRM